MTTALDIINRASSTMQDADFVRWSKAELLEYVSEAQVMVSHSPGAYSVRKVIDLAEGSRQSLPADTWSLISVVRNVDEDDVPITPVRLVSRSLLDAAVPLWHMEPKAPLVENYVYDDKVPREILVYPPNDGTGRVEVVYIGIPAKITDENEELVTDSSFDAAILLYVLYKAYCKESDYAPGVSNASAYYEAYKGELDMASQVRGRVSPNASLMPNTAVNANGGTE